MIGKAYMSYSAAVILQALANGYQYGFDIMDITGLPSGTVYPRSGRLRGDRLDRLQMGKTTHRPTCRKAASQVLRTDTRWHSCSGRSR